MPARCQISMKPTSCQVYRFFGTERIVNDQFRLNIQFINKPLTKSRQFAVNFTIFPNSKFENIKFQENELSRTTMCMSNREAHKHKKYIS